MMITRIIERTLSGLDKNNVPFKPYSKSYKDNSKFKAIGKNPGVVNLKFDRSMLNSLKLLRHTPGVLVIGFDLGHDNDVAAYNRLPRHGKVRDFLGLRPAEIRTITNRIPLPDPILIGIAEGVIDRILDDNEEDNEGDQ